MKRKDTYLGDGLYASDDGFMVTLKTSREEGLHYVALEPQVLTEFFLFLEKVKGVRITIEKVAVKAKGAMNSLQENHE